MKNHSGFYKVNIDNGGVCTCTFYNPETKESFSRITWDIDRPYINDDEEIEVLRYLPLSEDVRKQWLHNAGVIQIGDTIEVFKGRKVPKGTIGKVLDIRPYNDIYGRWQCDYAYLDNGMRTNINNCKLA